MYRRIQDPPQRPKMENFATVVTGFEPSPIIAKPFILAVCGSSLYDSGISPG